MNQVFFIWQQQQFINQDSLKVKVIHIHTLQMDTCYMILLIDTTTYEVMTIRSASGVYFTILLLHTYIVIIICMAYAVLSA